MFPKPQRPSSPSTAPTRAYASVIQAGQRELARYNSFLGSKQGAELKRKAATQKPSLLGG